MPSRQRRRQRGQRAARTVFTKTNYQLLLACVVLIAVGFAIMRIENEVDGFLSLYVSPLLLLTGYVGVIFAILWRPRPAGDADRTSTPTATSTQ